MVRVPSPFRRVARDRPRLGAVSLLALVSLAAAGISASAAERLQSLLDENWRGAYDILVTAPGNDGELAGLLAPNTLASGSDALTFDDLAVIRGVPDVEVAAPIGEVIVPGLSAASSIITLPKGYAGASDVPQSFRVTLTYRTNDGLGERFVSQESFQVVVDETERSLPDFEPLNGCTLNGFELDERYPTLLQACGRGFEMFANVSSTSGGNWNGSNNVDGDSILVQLGSTPMSATRITLIDPVAEKALLGTAGDFLDPLIDINPDSQTVVGPLNDWAARAGDAFAQNFLTQEADRESWQLGGPSPEYVKELRQLYEDNGADFAEYLGPPARYTALLVRDVGSAPLSLDVQVESFGPTVADTEQGYGYLLPEQLTSGAPGEFVGDSAGDISDLMNPFVTKSVTVPWPGTKHVELADATKYLSAGIYYTGTVQGVKFELVKSGRSGAEVRLPAVGFRSPVPDYQSFPDDVLKIEDDGTVPGMESVYTGAKKLPQVESGPIAVPVGAFSIDEIAALQSDLSFVPLGAYQSVGSTLIAGSSPHATSAVTMGPSANGMGLVGPETVAIASVNSAAMWGQNAPISAVRVRVADIDGFTAGAVAKVADVAQAIGKLGFSATVVSGSSPTDVTVDVENYAFGVSGPDEKQEVGPLGNVNQRWSELGAAARVDLAVSNTSFAILAVALGATALLLAAVQLAGVPGRRAQASVMRTIGWSRRRTVLWMAGEELVSLGIVVVAGAIALLLASSRSAVTIAVGGSVAALVVTSTLAVVLSARPLPSDIRPLRRGKRRHRMQEVQAWVTSTWRLALRQVGVHRLNATVQLLATIVVAVAASVVTATLIEGRAVAGASALGIFAVDQAFIAQLALGAVALIAGIVLAVIARRIDLVGRRQQWTTMRAMGWSVGQVRTVQVIEGLLVGIPAVAIAGGLAWWYLHEVANELIAAALPVGLAAVGVLTIILVLTSWREKK